MKKIDDSIMPPRTVRSQNPANIKTVTSSCTYEQNIFIMSKKDRGKT